MPIAFYAGYIVIEFELSYIRGLETPSDNPLKLIIMQTRNRFISAALEELSAEAGVASTKTEAVAVDTPAVTEVNIDSSTDAVATLMEKNSELVDTNATLESETFDNDIESVEQSSDSVQQDLEEAVAAGVGLEQLAHIIAADVRGGNVTRGAVAGYAMALEQLSHRGGVESPIAALEAEALQLEGPKDQAKAIGESAMAKAGEIAKRLMEGIQRVVGWLLGILRTFFARSTALAARAKKAYALLDSIDESKSIDSPAFVTSLRLVEGGGTPTEQFEAYAKLASTTLFGFFNTSFVKDVQDVLARARTEKHDEAAVLSGTTARVREILKVLMGTIYTEHGTGADVSAKLPENVDEKDLTVGLTAPCVGGMQLYLAATINQSDASSGKLMYCTSGQVKTPPAIQHGDSIPVIDKQRAKRLLGAVEGWLKSQKDLEQVFNALKVTNWVGQLTLNLEVIKVYMGLMTALASGCVPHLLRMNIQNAAALIAYVEKSAAVSGGAAKSDAK